MAIGTSVDAFRLDAQRVVDGAAEFLFAPEVPLGRLDRHVSQEELDLIQLSTGQVAEAGRRSAANHAGEFLDACPVGRLSNHLPDDFRGQAGAPHLAVWPPADDRLFRTAEFACSRSGSASTRFDAFFLGDFDFESFTDFRRFGVYRV